MLALELDRRARDAVQVEEKISRIRNRELGEAPAGERRVSTREKDRRSRRRRRRRGWGGGWVVAFALSVISLVSLLALRFPALLVLALFFGGVIFLTLTLLRKRRLATKEFADLRKRRLAAREFTAVHQQQVAAAHPQRPGIRGFFSRTWRAGRTLSSGGDQTTGQPDVEASLSDLGVVGVEPVSEEQFGLEDARKREVEQEKG